ncbi:MOSC domain-containing protein [Cohnella luojiensis]|uniref:MOSC domain-containing protein n=1 Tax=Cohnella luojiensis TaxID=652876 RepID=UPI003B834799
MEENTAYSLLSINIGNVKSSTYKGKEAKSGIVKSAITHAVALAELGLAGDEQADLVNHGGKDKSVCVYSADHYPHWENVLGRKLPHGTFGENFTVRGMSERDIHIGDVYQVGTAAVQVSQPRQPCWKLAMRWGLDELPLLVTESGATGFYLRVLENGVAANGDELRLMQTHPARITVEEANRLMHKDKEDAEGIRRLLAVKELSASWVNTLTKRLDRL